jgi:hypothetical protein
LKFSIGVCNKKEGQGIPLPNGRLKEWDPKADRRGLENLLTKVDQKKGFFHHVDLA